MSERMEAFERGGLTVRLAQIDDRARILAQRGQCFPRRDGQPPLWEDLDARALQVLVEGQEGLLASFRALVLPSGAALSQSYSAGFYDLTPLAGEARPIVEMGRLCLTKSPRAWEALRLLWAAMTRIVEGEGAGLMIGCASFQGADWRRHEAALALLAGQHLGPAHLRPRPLSLAGRVDFPALLGGHHPRAGLAGLPPLLRSYLAMGAWVSDHAVRDETLDTLHVFTCVDVAAIPQARAQSLRAVAR